MKPVVLSISDPIAEIKELIKADDLGMIRDLEQEIAYIFDLKGPEMCKQINEGIPQVIPDNLVCGLVAVVDLDLINAWRIKLV